MSTPLPSPHRPDGTPDLPAAQPLALNSPPSISARAEEGGEWTALQEILVGGVYERADDLQLRLDEVERLLTALEEQLNDREAFVAAVRPVIAEAIGVSIRESREDMVEALYPITGRLVSRAVAEAMRDLVRSIDSRTRNTLNFALLSQRVRARLSGVSDAEIVVRRALPFDVLEIFLIHRETGLLLTHLSPSLGAGADSDIISGMLTAIRDFAQDAFGRGQEGELDAVQYGEVQILIEAGKYAYLAAVVKGYEPTGFRSRMRQQLYEIEYTNYRRLRHYDGDAGLLVEVDEHLTPLLAGLDEPAQPPAPRSVRPQAGLSPTVLLLVAAYLFVVVLFLWGVYRLFAGG